MAAEKKSKKKERPPTGVAEIDNLPNALPCELNDYIKAVSTYVRIQRKLTDGVKKAAQIRLSNALALALKSDLASKIPYGERIYAGERRVAGALRSTRADVSHVHELDGLRLAIELKPVNLAVGRAIWNRFGDIRTFAVNLHLKFPFAVIGGVLTIPTIEEITSRSGEDENYDDLFDDPEGGIELVDDALELTIQDASTHANRKSTVHLINRAIQRLIRAGGRKVESDAPHLLEAIAVVAYDPDTASVDPDLPPKGSGLRWDEFIETLAQSYLARFED